MTTAVEKTALTENENLVTVITESSVRTLRLKPLTLRQSQEDFYHIEHENGYFVALIYVNEHGVAEICECSIDMHGETNGSFGSLDYALSRIQSVWERFVAESICFD